MEKTDSAATELSFLLRMLQAIPDAGSVEKIYRMLLALTTGGRDIGFDRAMLFLVSSEEGVIKGHLGIEQDFWQTAGDAAEGSRSEVGAGARSQERANSRKANQESKSSEAISYEDMAKKVFDAYERIDASDLTLKLRTYSVPFGWHRSALVKAARTSYPVLAEGKLSEYATDPFFEYFETQNYVAIPLKVNEDIRAVLAADNSLRKKPIDVDDISLLYSLCQQACQAIENLIAITENERRFRILLKLEQALQYADTREKIDEAIKLSLVMLSRAVGGSGSLLKDFIRNKTVHVKSVTGYSLDADEDDVAIAQCFGKILDKVAGGTESLSGDGGHALVDDSVADVLGHFFACPLSKTGDVSGVLAVYVANKEGKRERKAFSTSERKFLELCAGIIALKLDNRKKDERLNRQEQFLEEARSNLARERGRSRIGEMGIEYYQKIEDETRRIWRELQSETPVEKRVARIEDILRDIERDSMAYKSEFTLPDSHYQMIDIFKVVREVVNEWKPKAEDDGIDVIVRIPPRGPELLMDQEKISLAIGNILRSVSSSLRPEEKVLVEATTTDDRVFIVFADTGLGLPGNILSRLFMPFAEIGSRDERKRSLSLAGEILHTHAGEIKVKTSQNWKTILELSFAKMGNLDRRRGRRDRRKRTSDRRVPLKR
ncbi:MAG: hypothetical protein GTO51_01410 [Candidatus Latescibacteria bacterium]|nr:hypothetical protein [Candidatus Latescibacterota bacterium]NIM21658.1 hypothetical protein [Candidatus Latescibacterota bacterium]NIM64637.1 hypothetical protein [Candidatus Latescibacterota bacterium]NIO01152.1 hypothetical protein [Candidatus Latescibacterota bacterium]NIO27545.1 hypothetical protein [Candidatus Latescibacterota bacterium]